jgi:hypothetical protein
MATDDKFVNITNKKILTYDQMSTNFFDYLRNITEDSFAAQYRLSGFFDTQVAVTGTATGEVSVAGAFEGTDGLGKKFDVSSSDSRFQNVPFQNTNAINYHMGIRSIDMVNELDINPRSNSPEYRENIEEIGTKGNPDVVVDNGSTLTITVDTVTESGVSHAGREVRVYMVTPKATSWANAYEDLTVTWTGSNNKITTTGLLGQTAGLVSVTTGDYIVVEKGPIIVRQSTSDLTSVSGVAFLAEFLGNSGGAPSPIMTQQRVLTGSLSDLDELEELLNKSLGSMILNGFSYSSGTGGVVSYTSGTGWFPDYATGIGLVQYASPSIAVPDGSYYTYIVGTTGVLSYTATKSTAYTAGNLPISYVTLASGSVTAIKDLTFRVADLQKRGVITVAPAGRGTNFTDVQAAIDYIEIMRSESDGNWPGVELWLIGDMTVIDAIIPSACKGLKIKGVSSGDGRAKISNSSSGSHDASFLVDADDIIFENILFFQDITSNGSYGRCIRQVYSPSTTVYRTIFYNCRFDASTDRTSAVVEGTSALEWENCSFYKCIFEGSTSGANSFFVYGGPNWTFEDCMFSGGSTVTKISNTTTALRESVFTRCILDNIDEINILGSSGFPLPCTFNDCSVDVTDIECGRFINCRIEGSLYPTTANDNITIIGGKIENASNFLTKNYSSSILLRDVEIYCTGTTFITGTACDNIKIYGCTFSSDQTITGSPGLQLHGDCIIENNRFEQSRSTYAAGNLIEVEGADTVIRGNSIDASDWGSAIGLLTSGDFAIVSDNEIYADGLYAIYNNVSGGHRIINNKISSDDVGNVGAIFVQTADQTLIMGNWIFNFDGRGVYLNNCSQCRIVNNHLSVVGSSSSPFDIVLYQSNGCVVSGNILENPNSSGAAILLDGSSGNLSQYNVISGNSIWDVNYIDGIKLLQYSGHNAITGNTTHPSQTNGINIASGSNYNTIMSNSTGGTGTPNILDNGTGNQLKANNT